MAQLDDQNRCLGDIRKLLAEVERLESLNNTGLKIGDYQPYDRQALKQALEDQMLHKQALRDSERRSLRSQEQQQLEQLERAVELQRATGHLNSEELSQQRTGLAEQIRRNAELRASNEERDRREARDSTGLPLGKYQPDHRAELKAALEGQMQEKQVRAERERSQGREQDRAILEGVARALEAGRDSVPSDRFSKDLLADLETQAAEERRRRQEARDFQRLGDSGLGIGDYKGYDKQALIHALQTQIEEKQRLKATSQVPAPHAAAQARRRPRTPAAAADCAAGLCGPAAAVPRG